jgi:hypothetical protein
MLQKWLQSVLTRSPELGPCIKRLTAAAPEFSPLIIAAVAAADGIDVEIAGREIAALLAEEKVIAGE